MPRKAKGPRLYWRKPTKTRKGVYVIRDGQQQRSTFTDNYGEAEKQLKQYLIEKNRPKLQEASEFTVTSALAHYAEKHAPKTEDPERIAYAIEALDLWWNGFTVEQVTPDACEDYIAARRNGLAGRRPASDGTIRRELSCLRAALRFCHNRGHLASVPVVTLPPRPQGKDRWLTRDEVAALIRAARKSSDTRYLARFILVALYTGSRKTVVLRLKFQPHTMGGHVSLATSKLFRKDRSQRQTKKLAPPVSLPSRLSAHLRRWARNGSAWVIEHDGCGIGDIRNDWAKICKIAGVRNVTPHTLRHTAITWAMQSGANVWHVSGYFGVSLDTLEKEYAHHHPDHMKTAVTAANTMGKVAIKG